MTGNSSKPKPEDPNGGGDNIRHLPRSTPSQWPLGTRPEKAVPGRVTQIIEYPPRKPRSSWL